jgi:rfaE bifunctional protein kinase chain/domain
MNLQRFQEITESYGSLRIAVVGDFCLDRYLEIDPARQESSIETGLPVHNVMNVRAQAGGAGTIVNNLSALGVGTIHPIGFAGQDGEGYELWQALEALPGVKMSSFVRTAQRRTFTYCKPLLLNSGACPVELNRFDVKNWTPTPSLVQGLLLGRLDDVASSLDALILLDQVTVPDTGVLTRRVREAAGDLSVRRYDLPVLADSRRCLLGFPPMIYKMNVSELAAMSRQVATADLESARVGAWTLARTTGRAVFVTLAEQGILGATSAGIVEYRPALPTRGEIDVVGAGDAVMANLAVAIAAGATLAESLELANAAASAVIHKLGTTGTASVAEIGELVCEGDRT